MYCVIQEVQRKKPNTHGEYRELEAYSSFSIDGRPKYGYRYVGERFERTIKAAYKISIHESKRVDGVVTKSQYAVTTVGYYEIADGWFTLYDYGDQKITPIAAALHVDTSFIYDLIQVKLDPLEARIKAEYRKTEEGKTRSKHEKIIKRYQSKKSAFSKKYGVSGDTYDYCYNVFGEVMNQAYLDEIIRSSRQQSSYYKSPGGNYSGYDYSSRFAGVEISSYSEDEKAHLKKFYRTLSKTYHPDVNQGTDTTEEMKLLNKLKEEWNP